MKGILTLVTPAALALTMAVGIVPLQAAETGRYVRIDTLSQAMELAELEVYSGGVNLLRGHPELVLCSGYGLDGLLRNLNPKADAQHARVLTDGNADPAQRVSFCVPDPTLSTPFIEVDLGQERGLNQVVFVVSRYDNPNLRGWFSDPEGWRVVSVLDGQRRVISSRLVTLFTPEYMAAKGVMRVELTGETGPFVGRTVQAKSRGWFSLAEFMIGFLGVKPTPLAVDPDRGARVAEFTHRNDPDRLAAFAKGFFAGIDLTRPGLEAVRAQVEAGKYPEALEHYKRRLLDKMSYLDCLTPNGTYKFEPDPLSGAVVQAEDQFNYRTVNRKAQTVTICKPGEVLDFTVMPWGTSDSHPRSLLLVYAATGDPRYLARWAEMMDEWAIFYQRWADQGNRRDFFSHPRSLAFLSMCKDLRAAARLRPGLVDDLPAATLARVFKLISEENPPAYWRLARKMVFNHQFNAWGGAYFDSRMLEDFYIGQRLQLEMEQQFQRLWTLAMTRDGSMIEVADAGHMMMPLGTAGYVYLQMKEDKPTWFTPDLERWFLHYYRNSARYPVRYVAPNGMDHRFGEDGDFYGALEQILLSDPGPRFWYCQDFTTKPWPERAGGASISTEPEIRGILDTVYGRGRCRADLPLARQAAYDMVTKKLPGGYQGPPQTVSDYMPYAGIHYLRRGWAADDSFIEMFCQPTPGSSNTASMDILGSIHWDTQFHYWDFAEPLLQARPLLIDGQNQCRSFASKTWSPGSKTDRLTEAPEKPLPNRFHSSPAFDYQECFYSGAYQKWEVDPPSYTPGRGRMFPQQTLKITGPAITGVHTTRQVFQLRPERLFVVVDRVRFSDAQPHQITTDYMMLPKVKENAVETDAASGIIRMIKPTGAQLTIHQFGPPGLTYQLLDPVAGRKYLRASWSAQGETVLVSVLEPRRDPSAPETLTELKSLPIGDQVGFSATTRDGKRIVFSGPAKVVNAVASPAPEQAVLAVKSGNAWTGLALGTSAVDLDGRKVAMSVSDAEFAIPGTGGEPTFTPIYRPMDPPTVMPSQSVFLDNLAVSIASQTPEVEIRYTTDGSEPDVNSPVYREPFEITKSCMVQARAFRPGVKAIPFAIDGTRVSDISFAIFDKKPLKPALKPAGALQPGLAYDYLEGEWHRLFAAADRLPAKSSGVTEELMDVGMRQTDSTLAVRYQGYLTVPADGVFTFHAPPEYAHCNTPEPGYDLRVFLDGEEWRPGMMWHGFGEWSVALAKGPHRFMVTFADAREKDIEHQRIDYWCAYPAPWVVWRGTVPKLLLSGPDFERRAIPSTWLAH